MEKYNWNYPTTMWVGENRIKDLSLACKNLNISKPLLVTDNNLSKSNIVKNILSKLKTDNFSLNIYSISIIFILSLIVTAIASYIPARNISKMKTFRALKYE